MNRIILRIFKSQNIAQILACFSVFYINPISISANNQDTLSYSDNQFFVHLVENVTADTIEAMLEDLNSVKVWSRDDYDIALWQVNSFPFMTGDGQTISNITEAILKSKEKTKIRDATFNVITNNINAPTSTIGSCFDISPFEVPQGTNKIKIAILDTGISDLSDNSDSEFNFGLTTYSGYDYVNKDGDPNDEHGHGSHLAGIIHNAVTRQTSISQITYSIRKTHNAAGQAFMSDIVFAMSDVIDEGVDIINMSFGFYQIYDDSIFFPLKLMMENAAIHDILMVVAAGNDFQDNDTATFKSLPASFPLDHVISVASTDCNHTLSSFSNYGAATVDICVLGEQIPGPDLATGVTLASGTSQATAIITAAAALLGTYENDFDPLLTRCALMEGSRHFTDMADKVSSEGSLDLTKSLTLVNQVCSTLDDCQTAFTGSSQLQGLTNISSMIETNQDIESSANIQMSLQVTYDSYLSTTLLPGFEVQNNAEFQILADGCNH